MKQKPITKTFITLIIIFISLSSIIIFFSIIYHNRNISSLKYDKKQELTAVADLKVQDVENWIEQKKEDILYLSTSKRLKEFIINRGSASEREFEDLVDIIMQYHQLSDIIVVNPSGRILYHKEIEDSFISEDTKEYVSMCISYDSILLSDFYTCRQCKTTHIDLLAPVKEGDAVIGAVILRIDPEIYLFPFIQQWPTKSRTAETLILELRGDSVLFLNKLRHVENIPGQFKKSLESPELIDKNILTEGETFVEGRDYRNEPVMAAIRHIRGTVWWMVSKMDLKEAYEIVRIRTMSIYVIAGLIVIIFAGITGIFWYRTEREYYRQIGRAEEQLQDIKWMLSPVERPAVISVQPYGDLSILNSGGTIKKYIGKDMLEELSSWFMILLDSSSAIYEKNGDYVYETFASDWCKYLDNASRNLCGIGDNAFAMNSGKWHCHESCWECSKLSMDRKEPVDIRCRGGIYLYAVPILAGDAVVGSINMGYSDPPKDERTLRQIADNYNVDINLLREYSLKYETRPDFIVDLAKKRLINSAVLLGKIIELEQAKETLTVQKEELAVSIEQLQASEEELQASEEELKNQVDELTESKKELATARLMYSYLIENMYSAIAIYNYDEANDDFIIIEFNKSAEHIENISKEEVIGKRVTEIFPGVIDMGLIDIFRQVYRTGEPCEQESALYSDERITGYRQNYVYKLQTGEIVALYNDITERIRNEKEIRDSRNQLRNLFNTMAQGVLYFDPKGSIIDANASAEKILEKSREELLTMSSNSVNWHMVNEEGKVINHENFPSNIAMRTGESVNEYIMGVYFDRRDEYKWIRVNSMPEFREGESTPYRIYSVFDDITDIKLKHDYEHLQNRLNVKLSAATELQNVCDIVVETVTHIKGIDSGGIYLFDDDMNLHLICAKGLSRQFVEQKSFFRNDSVNVNFVMQGAPVFFTRDEFTEYFNAENPNEDYMASAILPIKLRGRVLGSLNVASHVSSNFPEFIKELLKSISMEIAFAIGRIKFENEKHKMQEMLYQSQKMEAIGQLAGGVAHDFNNMLAGIIGTAELILMDEALKPADRDEINKILNMAEVAAGRTAQLLAFSRRKDVKISKVKVDNILNSVIEILRTTIDKRIKISVRNECQGMEIMCDVSLIENALLNIGLNARDAMPEGGELDFHCLRVDMSEKDIISIQRDIKPGEYLKINIYDTGTGIKDDLKQHLFEPFFTTKGPGLGTGLGLAGAYSTVREHNGTITIESTEGEGTSVSIYLPVCLGNAENEVLHAEPEPVMNKTIMVIDDEEMIRSILERSLKKKKFSVLLSHGGNHALQEFRDKKDMIDLVILDMIMPEISGKELFEKLREIKPDIKVLISSGYTADDDMDIILQNGAMGFIKKPFKIDDIVREIYRILNS